MAYMKLRRNECESCELLIPFGFRFEKLNIRLQNGVYEGFKRLENNDGNKGQQRLNGQASRSFCMKVVYCPFEEDFNSQ